MLNVFGLIVAVRLLDALQRYSMDSQTKITVWTSVRDLIQPEENDTARAMAFQLLEHIASSLRPPIDNALKVHIIEVML